MHKFILKGRVIKMSVFSSKFKNISKKATAWSLAALTAIAGASTMPGVLTTEVKAADMLSNTDRGVIFANSRTDFRDESIYFLITTRFYDGDTSNNFRCVSDEEAKNPANDPSWRGDFKGLIDKLDYIKALGFTAIWITPVVQNNSNYDYHGYHASNFNAVDTRYESNGVTYQTLIDACHDKGIKVIQDVVFNHTCRNGEAGLNQLGGEVMTNQLSLPWPQMNEVIMSNGAKYDPNNIYHHNTFAGSGDYDNYNAQIMTIADDCFDLETENPVVANYLVDAYKKYIDMGVDAFRVDTARHISRITMNAGILPKLQAEAEKIGNDDFYMFGEVCTRGHDVWYRGVPAISTCFYTWDDSEAEKAKWSNTDLANNEALAEACYNNNTSGDNQPTSDNAFLKGNEYHQPDYSRRSDMGVIDFQMHWSFENAGSAFGTALGEDRYFNDSTWNVVYVNSHDYSPDFCSDKVYTGDTDAWAENLSLMFTFRGIPCVYYGTEIEFQKGCPIDKGPKAMLSETGRAYYGDNIEGDISTVDFTVMSAESGAVKTTLDKPLSQHIMRLNRIRQAIPALRKGQYSTEGCSGSGIAFKRRYTDSNTDSFVCVAISGGATFSGIPNGTYVDAVTGNTQTVSGGTLTANVSGKGNMAVYVLNTSKTPAPGRVIPDGAYLGNTSAAVIIGIESSTPPVPVESISLDKDTVSVLQGETVRVTATVAPSNATNKTVKWTSSDESIATVANGTIKGIAVGTATITATTNNGKTDNVKVTVKKNDNIVVPTGVTISPTSLELAKGKTGTLTATVAPSNATDKSVTWTSSNTSVATVSNGTVTAVAAGTATITAKTSNGKTATATVTVTGTGGGDNPTTYIDNGVYFKKPDGWSTVNVYIYAGSNTELAGGWPGSPMKDVGNGFMAYEFTSTASDIKVIFNNGAGVQYPSSNQPGFPFQNKGLYTSEGFSKVIEKQQDVAVTSVSVSPTSASVAVGATTTLSATVSPSNATNKTITWTSSDTSVATVSNGTVKGVKAGTATITAKSSNGKTATATITVTSTPSPTPLTNNSKISATTLTLGSSITLTGAASGGTSPYTYAYYYKKSSQDSWTTVKDFSSTTSVSITPASAATYNVCIKVKDKTGTVEKKYFNITPTTVSATMKVSASTINLGETVTASASGGSKYAFYYKKTSDENWTTAKDFSTTKSVTIKPAKATTYKICIKVKDSSGNVQKKYFDLTVKKGLTNTSTISATSITLGKTVTLKGSATGGTGYYNFAMLYKKASDSSWTTAQGFKPNETVSIKPAKATTYDVCVKVQDSNGTIVKKFFTVKVTNAALSNTSTLSSTSIKFGDTITVKAAATGGTTPYKYAVYYKASSASTWSTKQDFSTNNSVSIKFTGTGTKDVCVKVKDNSGTVAKRYFTVTVASSITNNSTVSATSVTKGGKVTVKFAASGGTSPYTYKVERMLVGSSSGWTAISNTSSTSTTVTIPTAATYQIKVTVTDSKKVTATKYFTVTGK